MRLSLRLCGPNEKLDINHLMAKHLCDKDRQLLFYREFFGHPQLQMPLLILGKDEQGKEVDVRRHPASVADIVELRLHASESVRERWQKNYFDTGDVSVSGINGDQLIVLDAFSSSYFAFTDFSNFASSSFYRAEVVSPQRNSSQSNFYKMAAIPGYELWSELNGKDDRYLYLTAKEVEQANGQGYVKKYGVWLPANETVGKVWDFLNRGRDLVSYIQLVCENSDVDADSTLLDIHFNQRIYERESTFELFGVGRLSYHSRVIGKNKSDLEGSLVGVVPKGYMGDVADRLVQEDFEYKKRVETDARIRCALEGGNPFEFNGTVYAPVSGVRLK